MMAILHITTYRSARAYFIELLRDTPYVPYPYVGVCGNLQVNCCYLVMKQHCMHWVHFSGDEVYPIPSQFPWRGAAFAYTQCCDGELHWKGNQLLLRRAYLRYLISVCDERELNYDYDEDE